MSGGVPPIGYGKREGPTGDKFPCSGDAGNGGRVRSGAKRNGAPWIPCPRPETAEAEFEPGDGAVEFVLVLRDGGTGEEGVYAVQEFVDGDLVEAGEYGLFVLPEIPLDAGGRRRLCGDALRSGHRREDDIRRFKNIGPSGW